MQFAVSTRSPLPDVPDCPPADPALCCMGYTVDPVSAPSDDRGPLPVSDPGSAPVPVRRSRRRPSGFPRAPGTRRATSCICCSGSRTSVAPASVVCCAPCDTPCSTRNGMPGSCWPCDRTRYLCPDDARTPGSISFPANSATFCPWSSNKPHTSVGYVVVRIPVPPQSSQVGLGASRNGWTASAACRAAS
jgi:hypothetical protein